MKLDAQELPHFIVGACMEVHRHTGRGLDARIYRECLAVELRMREIIFQRDSVLPVFYKGVKVETGVRVDFVIEETTLVSIEAVDTLTPEHKQRMRNELRLTGREIGLLINFNVENMRDGIKRIIVSDAPPVLRYREEKAIPAIGAARE